MNCLHCQKENAEHKVKPQNYFGTSTQTVTRMNQTDEEYFRYFCDPKCYTDWWNDLVWHLDTLDERMNANIHFKREKGLEGTYKGKKAHASWNGLEARHFLGEYEFENRRPHPDTCSGCILS